MLGGLINTLILLACVSIGALFLLSGDYLSVQWKIVTIPVFMAFFVSIVCYFTFGSRREWIKSYFNRNIRGYVADFWMRGTGEAETCLCEIDFHQNLSESNMPINCLVFYVPLGGWFKSRRCIIQERFDDEGAMILKGWSAVFNRVTLTGSVMIDLRFDWPDHATGGRESVKIEVDEAIRLLGFVRKHDNMGLSLVIGSLSGTLKSIERHLARNVEELKFERKIRQDLLGVFEQVAKQIEDSSRLKNTIGGLELLKTIYTVLHNVHIDGYTGKHEEWRTKLFNITQDIEKARCREEHKRSRGVKVDPTPCPTTPT